MKTVSHADDSEADGGVEQASEEEEEPESDNVEPSAEVEPVKNSSEPAQMRPTPSPPAPKPLRLVEPMNDIGLVIGWNAPSGWGGRYLRRVDDTPIAVGIGLAPLTLWGMKLSLIVRRAAESRFGFFQQVSVGFSTGAESYEAVVRSEDGAQTANLRKTPGRTLDLVLGYRWAVFSSSYAELIAGWSFNFKGTFLQQSDDELVLLPEETRNELAIQAPGGIVLGLTFGWRL